VFQRLVEEVARASRHNVPLSCVVFQVGEWGSLDPVADKDMMHAALVLARRVVRVSDVVGECGDGRFAVVANSDAEGAAVLASSVAGEIQSLEFVGQGGHVRVQVCHGAACYDGEKTAQILFDEASAALELHVAAQRVMGQC